MPLALRIPESIKLVVPEILHSTLRICSDATLGSSSGASSHRSLERDEQRAQEGDVNLLSSKFSHHVLFNEALSTDNCFCSSSETLAISIKTRDITKTVNNRTITLLSICSS